MIPKHRLITSSEINVWSPQAVFKEAVIFMRSWEQAEARCTVYILGMIHLYTHIGNPIQEYILNVYISLGHLRNIFTGHTDPSLTSESRFSVPLVRQADKIWAPLTRFILNTLGNRSFSFHYKQLKITKYLQLPKLLLVPSSWCSVWGLFLWTLWVNLHTCIGPERNIFF